MATPYSRLYHREMYADLIRAYLAAYGTQAKLARALGVTEAYLSYVLATPTGRWHDGLYLQPHVLNDVLRGLKTPSEQRASAVASLLCSDQERRDLLRYHINAVRAGTPVGRVEVLLDEAEVDSLVNRLGRTHGVALDGSDPSATKEAYARIWDAGPKVLARIDSARFVLQHVQVLLFLHDAASVLDRQDLALGYARSAQLALAAAGRRGIDYWLDRFWLNALLAEAVSLNNLGLWRDAVALAAAVAGEPSCVIEPQHWLRSLLEQQLTGMANDGRAHVYGAEVIADRALELASGDPIREAGTKVKLSHIYLARGTARSVRKAGRVLTGLVGLLAEGSSISPLRRVQLLRALVRYCHATGDRDGEHRWTTEAVATTVAARLSHQGRLA